MSNFVSVIDKSAISDADDLRSNRLAGAYLDVSNKGRDVWYAIKWNGKQLLFDSSKPVVFGESLTEIQGEIYESHVKTQCPSGFTQFHINECGDKYTAYSHTIVVYKSEFICNPASFEELAILCKRRSVRVEHKNLEALVLQHDSRASIQDVLAKFNMKVSSGGADFYKVTYKKELSERDQKQKEQAEAKKAYELEMKKLTHEPIDTVAITRLAMIIGPGEFRNLSKKKHPYAFYNTLCYGHNILGYNVTDFKALFECYEHVCGKNNKNYRSLPNWKSTIEPLAKVIEGKKLVVYDYGPAQAAHDWFIAFIEKECRALKIKITPLPKDPTKKK